MKLRKNKIGAIVLLAFVALGGGKGAAQGINYPGNSPLATAGAGNARTDADNLFTRNNAAGMTEIPAGERPADGSADGKWRLLIEGQGIGINYRRDFTQFGGSGVRVSSERIVNPSFSAELTYTPRSRRYAFGLGVYQIFGNQSKLKDERFVSLGLIADYDTKVASNDLSAGGAIRLHRKLSAGATMIAGRGFLVQNAPVAQLVPLGLIR